MTSEGNWQRRLKGYAPLSANMLRVLEDLKRAKDDEWPFIFLGEDVHKHTINALVRHNLIFGSEGLDGTRYTITAQGEKHLQVYSSKTRYNDGLCPTCRQRPKLIYETGLTAGYCEQCEKEYRRRRRQQGCRHVNPDRLCSICRERPVKIYSTGRARTWCEECHKKKRAEYRARKHQRKLARIHNGEVILCARCGEKPVHYTDKYVNDLCEDCRKQYMDDYNLRRRYTAVLERHGLV